MNFDWLDISVVQHEFGHALGLAHEHFNPDFPINWDETVAVPFYMRNQGWDEDRVRFNKFRTLSGPYLSSSDYDPFSIMNYPKPLIDESGRFLMSNPENCPSSSPNVCVDDNVGISNGDRDGIASIYPDANTRLAEIERCIADFIEYSSNANFRAHFLVFSTLPQSVQDGVLMRDDTLSFSTRFLRDREDDDCFLGFANRHITSEDYQLSVTRLPDGNGAAEVVKRINFTITGRVEIGCGFVA